MGLCKRASREPAPALRMAQSFSSLTPGLACRELVLRGFCAVCDASAWHQWRCWVISGRCSLMEVVCGRFPSLYFIRDLFRVPEPGLLKLSENYCDSNFNP